jgi:hypothetical protein
MGVLFIDSINTELREAIFTSSHDNGSEMGNTSDEITGKAGNEMRQVRTQNWTPDTSPKLKSLQDLSIRVNPKVTEEVMHHAGLLVCESSDPFHCALSLVNPITDVLLQRSIPVRVSGRGEGSGSEARVGVTVGGIVTTILMVTQVANPIPSVPLGLLRVSLHVVVACYAASIRAQPRVQGGLAKLWRTSPIRSNCSVRLS